MSGYYTGDGLGLGRLGAADKVYVPHPLASLGQPTGTFWGMLSPIQKAMYLASLASIPALGYHGYKRNDSIGWALVWGIFGSIVWPVMVPVAFVQGFGKRKRARANPRRRKRRSSRRLRRRRTSRRRR